MSRSKLFKEGTKKPTLINISTDDAEFLKKNMINLSHFVRQMIRRVKANELTYFQHTNIYETDTNDTE